MVRLNGEPAYRWPSYNKEMGGLVLKRARILAWAIALPLLLLIPYWLQSTPFAFVIRLAGIAGLYMLLALGLNLVIGFTGLLDLGFMAFYAIGAYTAALLAIHKVPFVLCVLASIFASTAIRVIVGFPALRLRGIIWRS